MSVKNQSFSIIEFRTRTVRFKNTVTRVIFKI